MSESVLKENGVRKGREIVKKMKEVEMEVTREKKIVPFRKGPSVAFCRRVNGLFSTNQG